MRTREKQAFLDQHGESMAPTHWASHSVSKTLSIVVSGHQDPWSPNPNLIRYSEILGPGLTHRGLAIVSNYIVESVEGVPGVTPFGSRLQGGLGSSYVGSTL